MLAHYLDQLENLRQIRPELGTAISCLYKCLHTPLNASSGQMERLKGIMGALFYLAYLWKRPGGVPANINLDDAVAEKKSVKVSKKPKKAKRDSLPREIKLSENLIDSKQEKKYNSDAVAGDISYMQKNDQFALSAANRKDIDQDGVLDIVAHGNSKFLEYNRGREQFLITHRTLAKILKNRSDYTEGQSIRLLSCSTGQGNHCFAQGLADKLNITVIAPNDLCWVDKDGGFKVSKIEVKYCSATGRGYSGPAEPPTGEFQIFKPRRSK